MRDIKKNASGLARPVPAVLFVYLFFFSRETNVQNVSFHCLMGTGEVIVLMLNSKCDGFEFVPNLFHYNYFYFLALLTNT